MWASAFSSVARSALSFIVPFLGGGQMHACQTDTGFGQALGRSL